MRKAASERGGLLFGGRPARHVPARADPKPERRKP